MYEQQFGLTANPFMLTPDPRFLYYGRSHREALAALLYGVNESRGFISLVGEVGTGKSTLIHALLEQLDPSLKTALISHSSLDRNEMLEMILLELGIAEQGLGRTAKLRALHDFVIGELEEERPPTVLILDEAQNLTPDVLEEIRLLTNLEIAAHKLLQVVLVGQPELEVILEQPEMRQLRQRIAVQASLSPLSESETREYIGHRLTVGGRQRSGLFSDRALDIIYDASGGVPRLINILCEQSLVNAFGAGREGVDGLMAMEAVKDSHLMRVAFPGLFSRRPVAPAPVALGGGQR